ncbi:MAG: response regulator [Symploca sp. SIO2B6]|nr:response regulator [Symploca sp. SIO2B6]
MSRSSRVNTYNQHHHPLVMIVDDDRFTRMMLRQIMEKEGYKIEEVEDGQQCLAAYQSHKPDMVLLDAMMPVMDGFTCCRQLQALAGDDCVPVLMITGLNDQASVDWAFEAGATDYITKPIHPPVLRQRLRRLFEARWAQQALQKSEKQYRSIVENVQEVIFETDAVGNWTFLNSAWTKLTGFKVIESLGSNYLHNVHPDDQQLHEELWSVLLAGYRASCRQEIRYLTKTGQCRWLEINAHSNLLTKGVLAGISGTIQDITERLYAEALEKDKLRLEIEIMERERSSQIMRQALEKEKELGELKSHVIATISHEFRTPLTTIQSSSELLANYSKKLSESKKLKHLQRIANSVERMSQLLNDVILLGEVEAGTLEFNPSWLNLEGLCSEIIEEFQQSLDDDQHTIVLWTQGESRNAKLDRNLLQHLLINLLSNAVKFSPQGGTINFDLICQQDQAIFRIEDQGIGIPLEAHNRVFESFYRASNTGTIKGTGLGLAIVKRCVDLHQGQIKVESEVGIGTVVTLTLPLT